MVVILAVGVLLTATTSDVAKVSEPGVKLYPDGTPFLVDQAGDWTGGEKTGLTRGRTAPSAQGYGRFAAAL